MPDSVAMSNGSVQTGQQLAESSSQLNLSMLTDFLLQKTYHEIMVLSELLPRKSDIERKIEIIQFASRARQQFIRLLALVKWASNSKRIQKCQAISTFLDQQNLYFVDTADMLARMSRETLVQARLPNFSLPTAIDVLTTGKFKRLPRCIKDRIVPPEPITSTEIEDTFSKLNVIIKHRLTSSKLPSQFSLVSIASGRLKLTVEDEFEVSLTVMGADANLPWRILKILFLVSDCSISEGKPLVHGLQTQYIHSILQSRVMSNEDALVEIYQCLHYFALSLQLEVFHMQARKLILERWMQAVKIESYITGQKLVLSYWRKQTAKKAGQEYCSVRITADVNEPSLVVSHDPQIASSNDIKLSKSHLSIETVLNEAIKERALFQLKELCIHLKREAFLASHCTLRESLPCLTLLPSNDACRGDCCHVTVDMKTGAYHLTVPDIGADHKKDLEAFLTGDQAAFLKVFNILRCVLHLAAIRKQMTCSAMTAVNTISSLSDPRGHLASLTNHRMFFVIPRLKQQYLALDVSVDMTTDAMQLVTRLFIISCHEVEKGEIPSTQPKIETGESQQKESLGPGYEVDGLFEIDVKGLMEFGTVSGAESIEGDGYGKRKLSDKVLRKTSKVARTESLHFSPVADETSLLAPWSSVLLFCCQRLPFVNLVKELTAAGITNGGVQYDAWTGHTVKLLEIPTSCKMEDCERRMMGTMLHEQQLQLNKSLDWELEVHIDSLSLEFPMVDDKKAAGAKLVVRRSFEGLDAKGVVEAIVHLWDAMYSFYKMAEELAAYDDTDNGLMKFAVGSFDLMSMVIFYGPCLEYKVTVHCDPLSSFDMSFTMTDVAVGRCNPHDIVRRALNDELNSHRNLPYTVKVLNATLAALEAINTIPFHAKLGTTTRLFMPLKDYTILAHSSSHLAIMYRDCFVLEIHMLENGVVIRDGSCSRVDPTKSVNNFYYLHQLSDFLSLYSDKAANRYTTDAGEHPATPGNPTTPINVDIAMSPADAMTSSGDVSRDRPAKSPAVVSPSPSSSQFIASPGTGAQSIPSPGTFLQPSPMVSMQVSASPGGWPASPAVPAVSSKASVQTQRYPATGLSGRCLIPVLLSTSSFCELISRQHGKQSPLDRYLGAVFFRRHLTRVARTDETLRLEKADPLIFSGNLIAGLQYTFRLHPHTKDSLCLKVNVKQGTEAQWTHDELRVMETYFDTKMACAPFKAHALTGFARLLGAQPKLLRDYIKVMLLELKPDTSLRWRVEWCFTVPMNTSNFVGTPAVVLKARSLFFLNFVETGAAQRTVPLSLVYMPDTNTVLFFEFPVVQGAPPEPPSWEKEMRHQATALLKVLSEQGSGQDCSIFPAIVHLLTNLPSS